MTKIKVINNLSKEELISILKESYSLKESLSKIFKQPTEPKGFLSRALKEKLKEYNLDLKKDFPHIGKTSPIWKTSSENFKKIIEQSRSVKEILSYFNMTNIGSNYRTLMQRFKAENIDYDEFVKKSFKTSFNKFEKINNEKIFIKESPVSRSVARRRILQEKLLEYKCQICGMEPVWNGVELSLTLDHINGVNNDHRLENLRFICPNCDRQLSTFAGKNVDKSKHIIPTKNSINLQKEKTKKLYKKITKPKKICAHKDCDIELKSNNKTGCCFKHLGEEKEKNKPYDNIQEVLDNVKLYGYTATGKRYGVSDNSIRKWLKKYKVELPKQKTFNERILELKEFVIEHGDLPNEKDNKLLYLWINHIRTMNKNESLTIKQINTLNSISKYILNGKDRYKDMFNKTLEEYKNFLKEYKRLPKRTNLNESYLHNWRRNQLHDHPEKKEIFDQVEKEVS